MENILAGGAIDPKGPLCRMERRDVYEVEAKLARFDPAVKWYQSARDTKLYQGWYADDDPPPDEVLKDEVTPKEIYDAVNPLHERLKAEWPELTPFSLLTMNARKELHFTLPENGPVELWYILTWMAPASLFMFLNRLCQAPHFLLPKVLPTYPKVTSAS
jgi:hypothetical protein